METVRSAGARDVNFAHARTAIFNRIGPLAALSLSRTPGTRLRLGTGRHPELHDHDIKEGAAM
jgi:hypothetical protein